MVYSNNGKGELRDLLASQIQSGATQIVNTPNFMSLGSVGSPSPTVGQTGLQLEVDRHSFSLVTTGTARKVTYEAFWSSLQATGNTIREVGIFAGSPGIMFDRNVYNIGVVKTNTVELTVEVTHEVF